MSNGFRAVLVFAVASWLAIAHANSQVAVTTDGPTRTSTSKPATARAPIRIIVALEHWVRPPPSRAALRRPRKPDTTYGTAKAGHYRATRRKRSALAMTDTELNVIAALAIIGLRSNPNTGYSTPAATGTPSTL